MGALAEAYMASKAKMRADLDATFAAEDRARQERSVAFRRYHDRGAIEIEAVGADVLMKVPAWYDCVMALSPDAAREMAVLLMKAAALAED